MGTGKTIVAFLAAIHAMREAGIQVAIMAPTEILARQLFDGWNQQFGHFGFTSDLLVGSVTPKQKKLIKDRLKS